jgi:glycosyltransferase involved in cell wall biosynthesis
MKTDTTPRRLRAALNWPAPRLARIHASQAAKGAYEEMDGLSRLSAHGVEPSVIEASPRHLNPLFSRGSMLAGLDPCRLVRQLWRYRQFDVLIGIDSSSVLLFVWVKRLLRLRKPVVVIDPALDAGYPRRMVLHRQVLPFVQHVVVYGQVQLEYLRANFGRQVPASFVPHRMDTEFFDPSRVEAAPSQEPYILAIGNDVGRDFETLIEASRGLHTRVVIHTRRRIHQPLPPNVTLRSDWISFIDLRMLYAGARLIVMPLHDTVHASGINSLLEAMSMAKHVIVTASQGVQDYVKEGETATVVPTRDPIALRQALVNQLADNANSMRIGQAARQALIQQQSLDSYSKRIAAILHAATSEAATGVTRSTTPPSRDL